MINISLESNPDLYSCDIGKCLEFLANIRDEDYQYPDNVVNFHLYTDIKNEKELLSVKSFIATQNRDKTILNLWTDVDISSNELIKPYLKYVNYRIYNPIKESLGTILEGKQEYLIAKDKRHWMQSGILRFLALSKYGGIWMDMDMVLLRDFKPIMDQEFAYMWENYTDFGRIGGKDQYGPCAALISGFKGGEFANKCLNKIVETRIRYNSACFDHELLAKVYREHKFTVFPSCFFNTEWQMKPDVSKPIIDGWFTKNDYSKNLYLQAFSWHWHNSHRSKWAVGLDSKFYNLQQVIDSKLREKGL